MNISYLLDYFKSREGSVTLSTALDGKAPVMFAHRGTPHTLIMPMFVND